MKGQKETTIRAFEFESSPTFANLWDNCLYSLLYDLSDYVSEVEDLLQKIKIDKTSNLIDVSAGTGFMSMELAEKGYNFEFMDAMDDEIKVFSKKAKEKNLQITCKKSTWLEIPKYYPKNHFDMAFCRGNSFIYAAGGWNKYNKINKMDSLKLYEKTLKVFYDALKEGGYLYIDKFKDDEVPGKTLVGKVKINEEYFDLLFYTEIKKDENIRKASMLLRDSNGKEKGLPNITYNLTMPELINMMKKVGFRYVKKVKFKNENHFDVLLARK